MVVKERLTLNEIKNRMDLKVIDMKYKAGFISSFVFALLAHGMVFFNKYAAFDEAGFIFDVGATYTSGRWFLGLLGSLHNFLLGSGNYSLPVVNCVTSIFFIAIAICIIIKMFNIKRIGSCVALSGVMVTAPVVTGTFGYVFTAPYYMLALLLSVVGAFLLCKTRKWYSFVLAVVAVTCTIGIYQAYLPVFIGLVLLYMIKTVFDREKADWIFFFKQGMYYITACVCIALSYFGVTKTVLSALKIELTDYMGINQMGAGNLNSYLYKIIIAYKEFFLPTYDSGANIYPMHSIYLYNIILGVLAVLTGVIVFRAINKSVKKAIQILFLILLLPLASDFIYVMCAPVNVHILMAYGKLLVYVYLIWAFENAITSNSVFKSAFYTSAISLMLLLSVIYINFSNTFYLKAELQQQKAISYFTTLVTHIKDVDGYTDSLPVAYINSKNVQDNSFVEVEAFEEVNIMPYDNGATIINSFYWKEFMLLWTGFSPSVVDDVSGYESLDTVKNMPSYPDDGSIRIIDGVVVVKF